MQYNKAEVSPDQLLLDPNNYRFHDVKGYKEVKQRARFQEPGVQDRALSLLQETTAFDLEALSDSIRTNGYIPVEQIVTVPYEADAAGKPRYLVVEGNRRAAILKLLLRQQDQGTVNLSAPVKASIENVPIVILNGTQQEIDSYTRTLMAIRHVAGIREWGPYQQAKLVVEMFGEAGATLGSVAQKIGISSKEVARRFRASSALKQMEEDEEFSEFAEPRLYTFFHEAVSQPKVREWLKFNETTNRAEDDEARRLFYELLSPREVDGERKPPKLNNATTQVRQLKEIVEKQYALDTLADPEKSFDDAVTAARADVVENDEGIVERSLAAAIVALKKPGLAYADASEEAKKLWAELQIHIKSIAALLK